MNELIIMALKSLAPKRNIICAYVSGIVVLLIGHFSVQFFQLNLSTEQTASISVAATVAAGHIWDIVAGVIAKKIAAKEAASAVTK